jgi:putative ABC transport system permease protein
VSSDVPLRGVRGGEFMELPGREGGVGIPSKRVDPGYFDALDIPVRAGRGILDQDGAGTPPVVVINEELARRLQKDFGIADPVGKTVSLRSPHYVKQKDVAKGELEIVGSSATSASAPCRIRHRPVVYVPLAQVPRPEIKLIVRTRGEAGSAMAEIREAVKQVDPDLALGDVRTMEQVREGSLSGARQPARVIGVFAAVAALLAALGLYGGPLAPSGAAASRDRNPHGPWRAPS